MQETATRQTSMVQVCKACGASGTGKYCAQCGQHYTTKRITLSGLLHDVFHLFTHLDKGFLFTIQQLVVAPGRMQRSYIEGDRVRHQKPFSLFFICATVAGLARYWIFTSLVALRGSDVGTEATFFHEYMVLMQIALLPVYALVTYLFFRRAGYNYAETGVLLMYTISFFFLVATLIALTKFISPDLDTAYIEFPILVVYNTITFIHFYRHQPRWLVVLKGLLVVAIVFLLNQLIEDFIISTISR